MVEPQRKPLSWRSILLSSLVVGLTFGAGKALIGAVVGAVLETDNSVTEDAISGFVLGAVLGPFYTWLAHRESEALGPLDRSQKRLARRSARRGAAPADPQIRRAAYRLALAHRDYVRKLRVPFLVFGALTIGLLLVLAVLTATQAARVVLPTVALILGIGLAALWFWLPGHWQRRTELLRNDLHDDDGPADDVLTGPAGPDRDVAR